MKKITKTLIYALAFTLILLFIYACKTQYLSFRSNYTDANELLYDTENIEKPFLKTHMKNGDVCIFKNLWEIDTIRNTVSGTPNCYDFQRKQKTEGETTIAISDVALFETNKPLNKTERSRMGALTALYVFNAALLAVCLSKPKACYGSCPTFYMNENDNFHYANAEGFSNAILPSMEYGDIDALNNPPMSENTFSITMKNEALETHCVNEVKLFAHPRGEGQRVYQSPENLFYLCENTHKPTRATAPEGDITALVNDNDRHERFSLSDEQNLSSREEIYLDFEDLEDPNNLGLIVNFRQTIMTTYLIYGMMGYMGNEVGDIAARIERSGKGSDGLKNGVLKELGNIDIYVWNEKSEDWELQSGFYETGPIAFNHQILPLQTSANKDDLKLKIVLNKGLWRIDFLGLTNIKQQVEPLEITPDNIEIEGCANAAALAQITNPDEYLISMPGDVYQFNFTLPKEHTDYELFLYSKGYYWEWMRENWLKDKNLLKLAQMRTMPKAYLKAEAKVYKTYEADMEEQFWNSKIDNKIISHYEN